MAGSTKCWPDVNLPPLQPGVVLRPLAEGAHAFVVLSHPAADGRLLVAAWTTLDEQCPDDECLLQPSDHPEISHASALAFSRARLWEAAKIQQSMTAGAVRLAAPLSPTVLKRVIASAHAARALRREWKSLLPAS